MLCAPLALCTPFLTAWIFDQWIPRSALSCICRLTRLRSGEFFFFKPSLTCRARLVSGVRHTHRPRHLRFSCRNPGCIWIFPREADLWEHYYSNHSSGSFSIRDPSLGDFTHPTEVGRYPVLGDNSAFSGTSGSFTPSTFDNSPAIDNLPFFDGSVGEGNDGRNGITTPFSTYHPERSITWSPVAEFDITTIDPLDYGRFSTNIGLTNPTFTGNPIAEFDIPTTNPFDYGRFPTNISLTNPTFAGNPVAGPSTASGASSINTIGTYQGNMGWNPNPANSLTYEPGFADYPSTNVSDSAVPQESRLDAREPSNLPSSSSSPLTFTRPRVPCPHCSKTFARRADMKRHARKHDSAAVRHSCRITRCVYVGERGFLRADKLRNHMRSAHGI